MLVHVDSRSMCTQSLYLLAALIWTACRLVGERAFPSSCTWILFDQLTKFLPLIFKRSFGK